MAVPAYTHDLIDWIADSDTTAWSEFTNMVSGGAPDEVDTESALQGTNTVSQITNTTTLFSMGRILGTPVTLASGQVFLVWHGHGVATALLSYASGGLRIVIGGNSLNDWKAYAVGGVDTPPFPYGKWVNNPVDPTLTADYTNGTPPTGATNIYNVGSAGILSQVVARGQPHVVDIIRYGRAQARFTGGETSNYCVFSGYATVNDAQTARWGLISTTAGGYLWKGLMLVGLSTVATTERARNANVATLTVASGHGLQVGDTVVVTGLGGTGYNATAVITARTATSISYANNGTNEGTTADTGGAINGVADFRDSNVNIFIQDTRKVYSAFNRIEIRNASTNVNWSGVNISNLSPSTTASKGELEVINNATVVMDSCNFTDMNTFVFLGNSSITNSRFLRCGQVTGNGGLFTGTSILSPTVAVDASAFIWNVTADTDGKLDNMTFSKGTNDHHAIQFGASADPVSNTLRGITFTGFNAANGSNDSALYFSDTGANVTWTVNLIDCSGTISYKKARAGDTVSLVSNPVTLSVHVQDIDTAAAIVGARVYIPVTSTASGRPYNQTINSITRSGSTATVTFATAHNLATNDYLKISGCDQPEYNQAFQVTVTGSTTLTVTVTGTPASGSGTMVGTWVIINGVTNGSGDISASYTYSASQPISGWVRFASGAGPYYKTAPVSGTVSSTAGLSVTVQLIPDA